MPEFDMRRRISRSGRFWSWLFSSAVDINLVSSFKFRCSKIWLFCGLFLRFARSFILGESNLLSGRHLLLALNDATIISITIKTIKYQSVNQKESRLGLVYKTSHNSWKYYSDGFILSRFLPLNLISTSSGKVDIRISKQTVSWWHSWQNTAVTHAVAPATRADWWLTLYIHNSLFSPSHYTHSGGW